MAVKHKLLIGIVCFGIVLCAAGMFVLMSPTKVTSKMSPAKVTENLELHLSAVETELRINEDVKVNARIINTGFETVRLVSPGDGSEIGWRTPITRWSITRLPESEGKPPEAYDPFSQARCGNINPLKVEEVFDLAPAETKDFGQEIYLPPFQKAGKYLVSYSYTNDPTREWAGIPLGSHESNAMLLVKDSTRCSLKSNRVLFTVVE